MYYIYTVGLSLSGKSELVKKIVESFPKTFVVIDTRSIHHMLNSMEPFQDDNSVEGSSYELRREATIEMRKCLIKFFVKENVSIIQDSSNLVRKEREERVNEVKKVFSEVKTILIFVNTKKQVVKQRAIKEDSDLEIPVWQDLFKKQLERIEIPVKDEADFFLEYDGNNYNSIITNLRKIFDDTMHS